MGYQVRLKGDVSEEVAGADAYVAEGPLTTFFLGRDGLKVLDSWTQRLASFRTADILAIRWLPILSEQDQPEPATARRYGRPLSLSEERRDAGPVVPAEQYAST